MGPPSRKIRRSMLLLKRSNTCLRNCLFENTRGNTTASCKVSHHIRHPKIYFSNLLISWTSIQVSADVLNRKTRETKKTHHCLLSLTKCYFSGHDRRVKNIHERNAQASAGAPVDVGGPWLPVQSWRGAKQLKIHWWHEHRCDIWRLDQPSSCRLLSSIKVW